MRLRGSELRLLLFDCYNINRCVSAATAAELIWLMLLCVCVCKYAIVLVCIKCF